MHTERARVAKQYSLQFRIFIEKDKCIGRLRRKTAKQLIDERLCRLPHPTMKPAEGGEGEMPVTAGVCCRLL